MGVQGRRQLEGPGLAGEVPDPHQAPGLAVVIGHVQLVGADVEGRTLPPIRGLDLNQSGPALGREAGDVVADAVALGPNRLGGLAR